MPALRSRSVLTIAVAVAGLVLAVGAPAVAAVTAKSSSSTRQVTSASWGAAGAAVGASPTGSAYTISWNLRTSTTQFFRIVNTGTADLVGQTYAASNSNGTLGLTPPTVAFDACAGATWNATANTCAGTIVPLTTTAKPATSVSITIPAGGAISARAQATGVLNLSIGFTTTLSVSVARSQARPATKTNS